MMTSKILVTGDRWWNDARTMHHVVSTFPKGTLIVHGACSGADWFADTIGKKLGFETDANPADWDRLKRAAGPVRNRDMLKKHPDIDWVYAFHNDIVNSKGTKDMVNVAEKARIPVELVTSRWPVIDAFRGDFAFLSNFYAHEFTWRGMPWPTLEHAYQAAKACRADDIRFVRSAQTAAEAKRRGRQINVSHGWDDYKFDVMWELLQCKFKDDTMKAMLLATDDATLVEGNSWGDTTWGICKGVGHNHLGELLMKLRNKVQVVG